jgi:PAS domain S-box-containing protein
MNGQEREEKSLDILRAALSTSSTPMAIYNPDGRMAYVNPAGVKFWGYGRAEEMVGRPVLKFWRSVEKASLVREALRAGGAWVGDAVARRQDGTRRDIHLSVALIREASGRPVGLVASCLDMTAHKRAETEAATHRQQLRRLAGEMSLAEERERRRIAGDLHDEVGQLLALAKLKMDLLNPEVSAGGGSFAPLREVYELVSEAAGKLPSVVFDLNAPALYREGFETALGQLAAEMGERHGLRVAFSDDGRAAALDGDMRVFLFRAVRELLVNVAKHARADNVQVSVLSTAREVLVAVEDDGVGCDQARLTGRSTGRGGFGLGNIWERMTYFGGRVEVRSRSGQGTRIALVLPLADGRGQKRPSGEALPIGDMLAAVVEPTGFQPEGGAR